MVRIDDVERLRVESRRSQFAVSLDGEVVSAAAAPGLSDQEAGAARDRLTSSGACLRNGAPPAPCGR